MRPVIGSLILIGAAVLSSCSKNEAEAPKTSAEATATPAASTAGGPHATVHLTDNSKVAGTIVASNQTEMVVAGDDGIERKIPLEKVKSVGFTGARASARPSRLRPLRRAESRRTLPRPRRRLRRRRSDDQNQRAAGRQ